jgi:hypothetical protein
MESTENLMGLLNEDCYNLVKTGLFIDRITIFTTFWFRQDCEQYPKLLFVFGDNDIKKGKGGQAIIRDCKNSIGIPTKKFPNRKETSFYTDEEYEKNCQKIISSLENIIKVFSKGEYDKLVLPKDGFGTGLAKLDIKAPKTLQFLDRLLYEVFGVDYKQIRQSV